jgi:hypothetical protein
MRLFEAVEDKTLFVEVGRRGDDFFIGKRDHAKKGYAMAWDEQRSPSTRIFFAQGRQFQQSIQMPQRMTF